MKIMTRYSVPATHPAFAGHFPDRPMFPGALLLDQVLHSIAQGNGQDLSSCEIQSVKFLSPALPGDKLEIRHETIDGGNLRFEVSAGPRKIASGTLKTMVT